MQRDRNQHLRSRQRGEAFGHALRQHPPGSEIPVEFQARQQAIQREGVVEGCMGFLKWRRMLQAVTAHASLRQWQSTTQAGWSLPRQRDMAGVAQIAARGPAFAADQAAQREHPGQRRGLAPVNFSGE